MKDLRLCIEEARAGKVLSDKEADEALDLFERFYNTTDTRLLIAEKDRVYHASEQVLNLKEAEVRHKQRIKLGTLMTKIELEDQLRGADDPYKMLESLASPRLNLAGNSVYLQEQALMNQILAPVNEFILAFRKGEALGTRFGTAKTRSVIKGQQEKLALMEDVVSELYKPKSTKNKFAQQLAEKWTEASENARLLYNRAGGAIRRNPDWHLPQPHHTGKIINAGKEQWKKFITDNELLNRDEMLDTFGSRALTDDELSKLLDDVYDSISTEGRNKVDLYVGQGFGTGKSIAKRHLEHRVLVFKDGASYLKYQRKFGEQDIFDVMINHIRSIAKDTASMQVFGPDSESTVRFLKAVIQDIADKSDNPQKNIYKAKDSAKIFDTMWQIHKGIPESTKPKIASGLRNFRALLMATKLGFTPLLALPTDFITTTRMARMNGMSPWKAATAYLGRIMSFDAEKRASIAAEAGLINQAMIDGSGAALARYLHEDNASPFFQFLVDSALRINGLSHITSAGRQSAGMFIMRNFAENATKSFDQLPKRMQQGLMRYNIDANKWGVIRRAKLKELKFGGTPVEYLTPRNILEIDGIDPGEARTLSDQYMQLVLGETEVAVPTVTPRERAQLAGATQPGDIPGEIVRSFAMFKSWPFAFFHTHVMRGLAEATTPMEKLTALADVSLFMMLGGALGVQLQQIAKGQKPHDMNPLSKEGTLFWGNALLRSGGAGPLLDIAVGMKDFGGGLSGYVAGPVIGDIDRIGYTIFGNIDKAIDGRETNFGTRLMKNVIGHLPYQSNWMLSLVMQRLVWERALLWSDPKFAKEINRKVRKDYREGREYWWLPGTDAPTDSIFN